MGITTRWRPLVAAFIAREGTASGVYELGDSADNVVYIGSADDLQRALRERLADMDKLMQQAVQYRASYTTQHRQREVELYEEYVALHGHPPCCNDSAPATAQPTAPATPLVHKAA